MAVRVTVFNTTNQSGTTVNKERWFTYDKEGRVLLGDAQMIGGSLQYVWQNGESVGYENTYDSAGRLAVTFTHKGTGTYVVNGVTYSGNLYDVSRNYYDDLGRLYSVEAAYFTKSSTGQWEAPTTVKGSITGGVTVTNAIQIRMRSTYDERGNLLASVSRSFKPNGAVDSLVGTSWLYRGDGKVVYQFSIDERNNTSSYQNTYFNDVGSIDGQGNQLNYRMDYIGSTNFTNTYTKTYAAYDGYKELTTTVTRSGFTPGVTTNTYSERGELMQVKATGSTPFTRQFATNREGLITSRREDSGVIQNYAYFKGAEVASIGNAKAPELSDALGMTWRSDYVASRPSSYAVNTGDTLASIARQLWGDSRMWYLIADANGLAVGANDPLEGGATLRIPAVVGSTQNNATTFKPYNPSDIIGDTTPNPQAPPPPPPKKKCGGLATIIMVVVAVVAVVVTAGAASAGIGAFAAGGFSGAATAAGAAVASGAAWSGGLAVLGSATTLAGFSAAVIGGAVGSAASQLTGMALGVVDKFSWRQVASGGLTAGAFAGLGGLLSTAQPGSWANTASNALQQKSIVGYSLKGVFSYGTSQAANRVAGLSTSFSWRDLAATMVGSVAAGTISNSSIFNGLNGLPRATVTGQLSALASAKIKDQWFGGGPVNYGQVAADAFGNALGNYVVDILGSNASLPESVQAVRSAGDVALDLGAGLGKLIDQFADERYRADLGLELELAEWDRRAVADERGSIFDFDGPIVASRLGLGGKEGGRNNYISFGAISHFDTKGVNNGLLVREVVGNYRESNDILLNSEQRLARVISLLEARESILLEVGVKYNVDPRAIAGAIAWEFSQNYSGYVSDSLLSPFFQEGYGWGQIHDKTLRQEIMPGVSIVRSFELRNDLNSAIDLIGLRIKNQADRFYQGSGLDLRGSPVASVWLYNTSSEYVSQAAIARHTLIESGSRNIVIDNNMASWLNKNIDIFKFSAPRGSVNVTGGSYSIDIFDGR